MDNRPSWDQYFIEITKLTSKRSNCLKRKVGCIIVKDYRILSLGYNGTPRGMKNCFEGGCKRCSDSNNTAGINLDICMCMHAEENAILFVSKADLMDSTLYVTLFPCVGCTKKIIQCGVKKIAYIETYNKEMEDLSRNLLTSVNIEIVNLLIDNNNNV